MNWRAYVPFHPAYPPEPYSTVCKCRDSHHEGYSSAPDIGSKIGTAGAELLHQISHATLADFSQDYVSQPKAVLLSVPVERVAFTQTKAEGIELEPGQEVDMVTAGECLHWVESGLAMPRVARLLWPGRTSAG